VSRKAKRKPVSEINVVPYIDVMLVLLIIFMITAPMLMQGVEVELPDAPAEPIDNQQDEPLIVSVKADGSYYLNLGGTPEKPEQLDVIKDKVGKVLKQKPKTPVLVWGDEKVPYGIVVTLMAKLQEAGAKNVGLVTENP
jgi:biopolymer transport protein TolR